MAKKLITAHLYKDALFIQPSDDAQNLYTTARFGTLAADGRLDLSPIEVLYLLEKKRLSLLDIKGKEIAFEAFLKKAKKTSPNLWTRFRVFSDLRDRGYIIKTALKFGADFRVYDRGVKPGEGHAKWIIYPVKEGTVFSWHDFAAKNRVAHSTKKHLMIGVVDDESDVTYYEIRWVRP